MRRVFGMTLFFAAAMMIPLMAQEQIKTPQPSPLATITQQIGVMEVKVEYSRPGVKDREIFGGLVPYNELWRTGANATTKFTFSDEVLIEGILVPAGDYGLYTIPGEEEWTIIFNKNLGWGTNRYDEKDDAARFTVKPVKHSGNVETFTIGFSNIRDNWSYVDLSWENTIVQFKIEFDVDSKVMAQIEQVMANPERNLANLYYNSADYYYKNDKDLKQSLAWVEKAIQMRNDAFWMVRLKSLIQAKMGDYKNAIKTAEQSKALAQKAGNQQYVKMNEDAIAEWKGKK